VAHRSRSIAACLAIASTVTLLPGLAMASENHPSRAWEVLETPHFSVHYYQGEEQSARRMAAAAESNLPRLAKDFGVEVHDKIPIVVSRDNFFNGSAEPVKTRIQLDPVLAASSVIGTDRFVAHELTHVITFLALQSDLPISRLNNLGALPTWFLEGIAQYEGEYWYTSNDRMLRLSTLSHKLLSDSERENFPMLGVIGGAFGYNEGFSITRYIFDTYGKDKIAALFKVLRSGQESTFAHAIEKVTGKPFTTILADWQGQLKAHYAKQTDHVSETVAGSRVLVPSERGEVNVHPRLSPDGKQLAFMSSRHQDGYLYLRGHVMGMLTLMVADPDGQHARELSVGKGRVTGYAWSPDGSQMVISAVSSNDDGEPTFDLFLYDFKTHKGRQLTHDANATDPSWKPGSDQVAYATTKDGQTTLMVMDVKSETAKAIPGQGLGDRHATDLAWSPDGQTLAASVFATGEGGKIAAVDPDTGHVKLWTEGPAERNDTQPTWAPDGKSLVFTSDRNGMQNLYRLTLAPKGELDQLSKIYAGAINPSFGPDGSLRFVSYRAIGSEIRSWSPTSGEPLSYHPPQDVQAGVRVANGQTPVLQHQLPDTWSVHAYEPTMTNDLVMPEIASDEKGSQLGAMALYSDILDKQQLGLDVRFGLMSQRFSYSAQYINRMFANTWGVTLSDAPTVGMADTIDPNNLYNSLYWAREQGASLFTQAQLRGSQTLTAALGLSYLSVLTPPMGGTSLGLRTGRVSSVSLAWNDEQVKHTVDADINPSDGYRAGASMTLSDHSLGSDFNFTQYALGLEKYVPLFPEWRHNLAWSAHVAINQGDAVPLFLGGVMGGGPIVPLRGYNVGSFVGNRLAYTGLEYTAPLVQNVNYQLGPIFVNQIYGSGFLEAGDAWNAGGPFAWHATTGAEVRIKTAFMGRQIVTFRIGVAHKLTPGGDWGMYMAF